MKPSHIEYLYSLDRLGIKPGLERMEAIMEALGHPERQFKSIHISGTNGKGSVAAMIESALRTSGKRTGLYTSPDLYSFHERMRINGESIADSDLAALITEVREAAEHHDIQLTFFEFSTAVCYLYFARQHLDIAIIEVGMGGLLDATNVITPIVSVITNVGLDHQEFLGDTKEKIAYEKGGIIKHGVPCVVGKLDADVFNVIATICEENKSALVRAKQEVQVESLEKREGGQFVCVSGGIKAECTLPLLGAHQLENAEVALAALLQLPDDLRPNIDAITQGIEKTVWEGRLDIVSENPLIIVDGAHNTDGVRALIAYMQPIPKRDVLVFGLKKGKEVDDSIVRLVRMFDSVIVSEGNYQPQEAEGLAVALSGNANTHAEANMGRAIEKARTLAGSAGTIVIAGSLYLVADALAYIRKEIPVVSRNMLHSSA